MALFLVVFILGVGLFFVLVEKLQGRAGLTPASASPPPVALPAPSRGAPRQRMVATAPWGGVLLECGVNRMLLFLLPIADSDPYDAVLELPSGVIEAVIVLNTGSRGVLAGSLVASRSGTSKLFAVDPGKPIDRGHVPAGPALFAQPLPTTRLGDATVTAVPEGFRVDFSDGGRALVGDALRLASFFDSGAQIIAGAMSSDPGPMSGTISALPRQVVLLRNVPGNDASHVARVLSQLGISSVVSGPEDAETQIASLLAAGKVAEAEAAARARVARGVALDRMSFQLGIAALMRRDEPAAITAFEAGAAAGSAESCSSLAGLLARRGDRRALDFAKRATEALPGDPIALKSAILAHVRLGDAAAARVLLDANREGLEAADLALLETALEGKVDLERGSHSFPAHARLASADAQRLRTQRKNAEAEAPARRAVELDRDAPEHVAELGTLLSELGREREALAVYDEAIARGGAHTLLRFNRGNCQLRAARYGEAAADYRACLELKADWHEVRVNLASALFAAKDLPAARLELQELRERKAPEAFITGVEQMLAGR